MIESIQVIPPWAPEPGEEFLARTDLTGERWHRFRLLGNAHSVRFRWHVLPLSSDPPPLCATLTKIIPIPPGYDPDMNLDADGNLIQR